MLSCFFVVLCFADLGKNNFKLMSIRQFHVAQAGLKLPYISKDDLVFLPPPPKCYTSQKDKYRSNL